MLQMYIKYYYLQIIWRFFFLNVLEKMSKPIIRYLFFSFLQRNESYENDTEYSVSDKHADCV